MLFNCIFKMTNLNKSHHCMQLYSGRCLQFVATSETLHSPAPGPNKALQVMGNYGSEFMSVDCSVIITINVF